MKTQITVEDLAAERLALADRLGGLADHQWAAPSLCAGWTVRDVLGHLVYLAEGTRLRVFADGLRHGGGVRVNHAMDVAARKTATAEPAELLARLRKAARGTFGAPFLGLAAPLGDILVHGSDMQRPLGIERPPIDGARLHDVLRLYRRIGPVFGMGNRPAKVRFVAVDVDVSVGEGPEVRGTGEALALAAAGRPVGEDELHGAGVDSLRPRRLPREG